MTTTIVSKMNEETVPFSSVERDEWFLFGEELFCKEGASSFGVGEDNTWRHDFAPGIQVTRVDVTLIITRPK